MSVPKLRFPGFTGEWEEKPLSFAIASLDAGVSVNSGEGLASDGESGVLKTSCVTLGVFDPTENKIVDQVSELKRLKEQVKAGTIIISRMNTPALVGANAYVSKNSPNLFLPDRLWAAKIKQTASSRWIALLLGHSGTRRALSDRATGTSGSMKNLTKSDVLTLPIFLPILHEQQKIAAFLGAVDAKLAALASRQVALGRFKAGLMQKLFSQQLRFTRDDGQAFPDWQEIELRAVSIINPKSPKLPNRFRYIDLESVNAGTLGAVGEIDATEAPSRAQRVLQRGDILYQMVRPYQRNNLYFDLDGVYVGSTGYAQIRARQNRQYLFHVLHTDEFVNRVLERCTGTGYPAINSNDLGKVTVPFPHPDEQQKIANALSAMDAKIQAVTDQATKLQTFKKGLLQQMFV